jgi:hypothetical protein
VSTEALRQIQPMGVEAAFSAIEIRASKILSVERTAAGRPRT